MAERLIDRAVQERFFDGRLALSAGRFSVAEGERVIGPMRRGLKIAVLLDGRQTLKVDDRPAVALEGPSLLIAANSGDHQQQRTGLTGGEWRCALLQFDLDFVEHEFDAPIRKLLALAGAGDAGLWVRPAAAEIRTLAVRLADPAAPSPLRKLDLAGQALDLASTALREIVGRPPLRPSRLPARTRDQVRAVQEALLARMQAPPNLGELARMSGLNPTRLTSAFRSEFGMSVFEYLQERRLQTAHALIAGGEAGIAEAAYRVGYSPAHFSSLFRKRFGISPSALR